MRQLVRHLVYTTFINNNRTSFHLRWKKNLVKHQKVSKYYETDCRYYKLGYLLPVSTEHYDIHATNSYLFVIFFEQVIRPIKTQDSILISKLKRTCGINKLLNIIPFENILPSIQWTHINRLNLTYLAMVSVHSKTK